MKKYLSYIIVIFVVCFNNTVFAVNNDSVELQKKRQEFLEKYSSLGIVRISELSPTHYDFWFEIPYEERGFRVEYDLQRNFFDTYYTSNEQKRTNIETNDVRTTNNTAYIVYNSDGVQIVSQPISNLFQAINTASVLGNYVQETDTGKIVFRKDNNENTYYRFQYTNYYDADWALAYSPNEWVDGFRYAHVIDGTGHIVANSYYIVGGGEVPYWGLEPESGSYYYKRSLNQMPKSASGTIDLTGVTYKINIPQNNLYLFTAVQNSEYAIEIGVMCSRESQGKWWHYTRDEQSGWDVRVYPNRIAATPTSSNNSTYIYSFSSGAIDIKLSLSNTVNVLTGYVNDTYYGLSGGGFSITDGNTFIQAVSMPQAVSENELPNLRCGSYFKNVKLTNCKLYSNVNYSGSVFNFYPDNTSVIDTAYIYCDDTITYERVNSTTEKVDIDYSIGYHN